MSLGECNYNWDIHTVYSLYYEIWYLYDEYYPCQDSQADVAMCPGDKRPLFHGYKKISDPKTNLKHDCFIEFVNITVYEKLQVPQFLWIFFFLFS